MQAMTMIIESQTATVNQITSYSQSATLSENPQDASTPIESDEHEHIERGMSTQFLRAGHETYRPGLE